MEKLIITAAITGAATVPSLTPYLPLTPQQIADSAIEAAKAGAAIVHIHARVVLRMGSLHQLPNISGKFSRESKKRATL